MSQPRCNERQCFYTGSLEGEDGEGNGKLLHGLADKRCANYKTCGEDGNQSSGRAKVNIDMFKLLETGQLQLQQSKCNEARATAEEIIKLMYIPMIQGSLRYAYKVSELQGGEKEKAEGSVFTAAVLPRIHAASPEAAQIIYDNMKVGAATTDHVAVKKAYESVYTSLGITCEDVGGLWFDAEERYYETMEPCMTADANASTENQASSGSEASTGSDASMGSDVSTGSDASTGSGTSSGSATSTENDSSSGSEATTDNEASTAKSPESSSARSGLGYVFSFSAAMVLYVCL